jgi:hypothetical protein
LKLKGWTAIPDTSLSEDARGAGQDASIAPVDDRDPISRAPHDNFFGNPTRGKEDRTGRSDVVSY